MNEIIEKSYQNVFKCENKEDIISFIKTVETENNNNISSMIHNNFETMFELETLLLKLQKLMKKQEDYSDNAILINDNTDEIKDVIQKIKFKLLTIDKQKQEHQMMIDECFSDTKLCYHIMNCNKDLIM